MNDVLRRYPENAELYWVQEEPENMGAWNYVEEQMQSIIDKRELRYVGRVLAASPAAGAHKVHHDQQEALSAQAFSANPGAVLTARRLVRKKRLNIARSLSPSSSASRSASSRARLA